MTHIKSLDGLRAIAVLLVLYYHWNGGDFWGIKIELGTLGVYIFFVLSGFLISSLLLISNEESIFKKLKKFYLKRVLRILPIYYIFIFVLYLIDYDDIRNDVFFYIFHVQNFLFYYKDVSPFITHLWSLGIEEQFYLFWPLLILLLKKEYIFTLSVFVIVGTPIGNLLFKHFTEHYAFGLPMFALEGFAWGYIATTLVNRSINVHLYFLLATLFFILYIIIDSVSNIDISFIERGIYSFFSFTILMLILLNQSDKLKKFCELKYLVFVGKISYGIYLFHRVVPEVYLYFHEMVVRNNLRLPFFDFVVLPYLPSQYMIFIYLPITLCIATISFYLIENPLLKLKRKI
jgi:peptidoglycan/LPS O-acetylase OafA/YrhL